MSHSVPAILKLFHICLLLYRARLDNIIPVSECRGLECSNSGVVEFVDDMCHCVCPSGFSGIFCELGSEDSEWPAGPYYLPMSRYGCPEPEHRGWKRGYIRITTKEPMSLVFSHDLHFQFNLNKSFERSNFSFINDELFTANASIFAKGPFNDFVYQMNFCFKSDFNNSKTTGSWPKGAYGVYASENGCPEDFDRHQHTLIMKEILNWNADGYFPEFTINRNGTLNLVMCLTNNKINSNNVQGTNFPYSLLKHISMDCPEHEGYKLQQETITMVGDSKEQDGMDVNNESYSGMTYCHYIPTDSTPTLQKLPMYGIFSIQTPTFVYSSKFEMHEKLKTIRKNIPPSRFVFINLSPFRSFPEMRTALSQVQAMEEAPWILVDLFRTTSVTSIYAHVQIVDVPLKEYPDLYVSDEKWSFLHNGADLSKYYTYNVNRDGAIEHKFYTIVRGRYVSVVAHRYQTSADVAKYMMNLMIFQVITGQNGEDHSHNESIRCLMELGMQDGAIASFQLTASSWHDQYTPDGATPTGVGWCAGKNDPDPYIQVDLLFAILVEGVTIYNWYVETIDKIQNQFQRTIEPFGARAFHVAYGFNEQSLRQYNTKDFEIDLSTDYSTPQTFLFLKPFLARLVRIYTESLHSTNCLRFELLGCRKSHPRQLLCTVDRQSKVVNVSEAYVALDDGEDFTSVQSWDDCESLCLSDKQQCSLTDYDPANKLCELYPPSETNHYQRYQNLTRGSIVSQHICFKDPVEIQQMAFNVHEIDVHLVGNIGENETIVSYGFPFYYDGNQEAMWKIRVEEHLFVNLLITNISLNVYEEMDMDHTCRDYIIVLQASSYIALQNTVKYVFSHEDNNDQSVVVSQHSELTLLFLTCFSGVPLKFRGNGFRALVKATDIPYCGPVFIEPNEVCSRDSMALASLSYLSLYGHKRQWDYTWVIKASMFDIIILTLTDFNVQCYTGTVFNIRFLDANGKTYCNTDRPPSRIRSLINTLGVIYSTKRTTSTSIWEGFRAVYHFEKIENMIPKLSTSINERKMEACSVELNKCYSYGVLGYTASRGPDFNRSKDECSSINMSLISLHSEEEMTFVRQVLHQLVYRFMGLEFCDGGYCFPTSFAGAPFTVVIGLQLITDRHGETREMWQDNTPVTFTAWNQGETLNRLVERCTYMDYQILEDKTPWLAGDCTSTQGSLVFICEKEIDETRITDNVLNSWIMDESQQANTEGLYKCGSGEWISVLSRCDGLPECRDRSDELNCLQDIHTYEWSDFRCDSGRLISMSRVCDHVSDCPDGEDEYCDFPRCPQNEFQCANKQCVPDYKRCDATIDCIDRSDEINCDQCQSPAAFLCGDQTCIPSNLVCDYIADCEDGEDEMSCEDTSFDSCIQWWEAGYRENGIYRIGEIFVECNFDDIWTENVVRTVVQNRTIYVSGTENPSREYEQGLASLISANNCTQKVYSTCLPVRQEIASYDGIYSGRHSMYTQCTCLVVTSQLQGTDRLTQCDGGTANLLFNPQRQFFSPIWYMSSDIFENYQMFEGVRYSLKQMTCDKPFLPSTGDIVCANSHTVISDSRRCLYDEDIMGRPLGCRSMEHVQRCENFVCPSDYLKCPGSFCISTRLVCDGTKHCKNGEDEIDCWCKEPSHNVAIVTFGDSSNIPYQYITSLAEQFLSEANKVKIVHIFEEDASLEYDPFSPNQYISNNKSVHEETLIWGEWASGKFFNRISYSAEDQDVMLRVTESLDCQLAKCAVIFISEDGPSDSVKRMVFNTDGVNGNVTFYNVTSEATIKKTSLFANVGDVTNVIVRDMKVLANTGSTLFPELCEDNGFDSRYLDGGYLCFGTRSIIPDVQVCDGEIQCPSGDDETLCNIDCPAKCSCDGYVADCREVSFSDSDWDSIPTSIRTVDLSKNYGITTIKTHIKRPFLIKLNMSYCSLQNISEDVLKAGYFPSLKVLDLRYNKIAIIKSHTFSSLHLLEVLRLDGNKELKDIESEAFIGLVNLIEFTVSGVNTVTLRANGFAGLDLETLDLSGNHISAVEGQAFNGLKAKVINLLSNDIKDFNKDMFTGASSVETLLMPAYKFCCVRPHYVEEDSCSPSKDEFSSCEDLMRNPILQTLLWIIGICALLGNILSLMYRMIYDRDRLKIGYGIFVTNLTVADLFMGCYMIIIAIADVSFRKRYIWLDDYWRNSGWCTFAGALSTASSEASVLFICFITLDRLLVIKYPFGEVRFHSGTAWIICAVVWVFTTIAAITPIAYVDYFQDKFYAKSAVCLALPITRDRSSGWLYSFILFIGVNFVTFVAIAFGQWLIYNEVSNTSIAKVKTKSRHNDLHVARNLLLVATTDFLCWFPIGCMGIIALAGHPISGDVYAWAAVLILPINSALNPFLYTLSAVLGKKKFVPDVEEASRNELSIEQFIQLWNYQTFARKCEYTADKSLRDCMTQKSLSVETVYSIAVKLIQAVDMLHGCHLVHGSLSPDSVIISRRMGRRVIRLRLDPQLRQSPLTNRAADINDLGCIIRSLIRNID